MVLQDPADYDGDLCDGGESYGNVISDDSGNDGAVGMNFNPSRYANPPEAGIQRAAAAM